MCKKIFSVVLCVILVVTASLAVSAQSNPGNISTPDGQVVQPCFTYINLGETYLHITSSGQAQCTAFIFCYSTVDRISITMRLEKKGFLGLYWSTVTTWSQTFSGNMAELYKKYSVSSGTYRIRADYVAYSGSASESHTGYSPEEKY